MSVTESLVRIKHDTGYGDMLLSSINGSLHGKDMMAMELVALGEWSLPQWLDEPTNGGWHWCESLEADAPPQLIRRADRISFRSDGTYDLNGTIWHRWTVAGWVTLVGRVSPCTGRPS